MISLTFDLTNLLSDWIRVRRDFHRLNLGANKQQFNAVVGMGGELVESPL